MSDEIHFTEAAHWDDPEWDKIKPNFKRLVADGCHSFSCGCWWEYSICPAKEEHVYTYCKKHKDDHKGLWDANKSTD